MTLTQERPHTIGPGRRLTARIAGWTAVGFGVVHTVVAPWDYREYWADILDKGPWESLTLDHGPGAMGYSEAFWIGPASFGVPVLFVGAFVLWATRRGERIPAGFGWALTLWGGLLSALMPVSPAWALLAAGVLLVVSARERADAHSQSR